MDRPRAFGKEEPGGQRPITLSDCDWSAASVRDPPLCAATWVARVPVPAAPEREICVAMATPQLALMPM